MLLYVWLKWILHICNDLPRYRLLLFPILYKKAKKRFESMLLYCVHCVFSSIFKHSSSIYLTLLISRVAQAETCYICNLVVGSRRNSPLAEGIHRGVSHMALQSCCYVISLLLMKTHPKTLHPRLNDLSVSQNLTCHSHSISAKNF